MNTGEWGSQEKRPQQVDSQPTEDNCVESTRDETEDRTLYLYVEYR